MRARSDPSDLTKVVVDLPNHWATGSESMWARPLGGGLYEIRNVPFYAYGLNHLDVVRAIAPSADDPPVVRDVVRPSGHRTLRVYFNGTTRESEQADLLRQLDGYGASFEGAQSGHAIDVEPEGDYAAVQARLDQWARAGLLEYETCEARVPGSFDDLPGARRTPRDKSR